MIIIFYIIVISKKSDHAFKCIFQFLCLLFLKLWYIGVVSYLIQYTCVVCEGILCASNMYRYDSHSFLLHGLRVFWHNLLASTSRSYMALPMPISFILCGSEGKKRQLWSLLLMQKLMKYWVHPCADLMHLRLCRCIALTNHYPSH